MEYKEDNNGGGGGGVSDDDDDDDDDDDGDDDGDDDDDDDDDDFDKMQILWPVDETIDHLVSGCPELAKTEYFHRHNKAAAYMHRKICKEFGIALKERWYEHEPKTVTKKDSVTIL